MYHNLIKYSKPTENNKNSSSNVEDLALFLPINQKVRIARYRMSKKGKGLNKCNSVGSALVKGMINAIMRAVHLHNPANDFWFPESLVEAKSLFENCRNLP